MYQKVNYFTDHKCKENKPKHKKKTDTLEAALPLPYKDSTRFQKLFTIQKVRDAKERELAYLFSRSSIASSKNSESVLHNIQEGLPAMLILFN